MSISTDNVMLIHLLLNIDNPHGHDIIDIYILSHFLINATVRIILCGAAIAVFGIYCKYAGFSLELRVVLRYNGIKSTAKSRT
jgi:hypothetical protein